MLTDEDLHRESLSDNIEEGTKNGIRSILIIPICSPLRPPSKRGEIVFPIFHRSLRIPLVYQDSTGISGFHRYIGISPVYRDFTGISGFHRYIGISPVYRDFTGFSGFRWFLRVSPEKLPSPLAGRCWGGAIRDDGRNTG